MCKFFNSYEESLHVVVCKLAKYVRTCVVFWRKKYTADKHLTRPAVETNSMSEQYIPMINTLYTTPSPLVYHQSGDY